MCTFSSELLWKTWYFPCCRWLKTRKWQLCILLPLSYAFHSCSVATYSLEIHLEQCKYFLEKTSLCIADFVKHEGFKDLRCYLFIGTSQHVTTKLMHLSEYHKYLLVIVTVFWSICIHLSGPICSVQLQETVNLYWYILKWLCKSLAGIS